MKTSNSIAVAGILALSVANMGLATAAKAAVASNADGSITLQQAHDAASKKFDALDTKHTGKLTEKQVSPVSRAMGEMARHDKDHTIDRTEYMAGVDAAFQEADPKAAGMLTTDALKTKAGKHFLALVE